MSEEARNSRPSRRSLMTGGVAMLGAGFIGEAKAAASLAMPDRAHVAAPPDSPPAGYNILFILVDQEHFFPSWPFPVPAREWIKRNGVTFANHQIASCVCSPSRSTIYTGLHIQHSGIFDNLNSLWQPDLSTSLRTIGHRMGMLGYYASYQGKWHLSANLDVATKAIDAPFPTYRTILESYGFDDFFGVGDINDKGLGGYTFDDTTTAAITSWLRTKGKALHIAGKPWFLAANFVNPHDVMYVDSDLPGQTLQGVRPAMPIFRPPEDAIYAARWDDVPLPASRSQKLDAPGRPKGQQIYQQVQDILVGPWPDEDRRWRVLRNYYYNCIRDCDRQVAALLAALHEAGIADRTIVVFAADHGELSGNHQMRGKGNCSFWQQNHVPLMIMHPAYPGGATCKAVTSHIDLAPTLLALTGAKQAALDSAASDLKGRDLSGLLKAPMAAGLHAVRPAALFNYNMLTFQDAAWTERTIYFMDSRNVPTQDKIQAALAHEPDFHDRCAIRSVFDGRYRFSRYFAPLRFNTPTTLDALFADNDVELYDLWNDPEEMDNLAMDQTRHGKLILAMNELLNARIAAEVGSDDGTFLPIRDGKWFFPPAGKR